MAVQYVNIGTSANDHTGDTIRAAFDKLNDNWLEYANTAKIAVVDTITALRSGPLYPVVMVLGYTTAYDGKGGPLRILVTGASPGTFVDNGFSVIVPTGGDGSAAWGLDDRAVTYVDTVAALRSGPLYPIVQLKGELSGSTATDGNGGPLRVLITGASPGTYVNDGFVVITPSGGDGSSAWVLAQKTVTYVDTIEALRESPPYPVVQVLGELDKGDGLGGALRVWISGAAPDTYSDDGVGVIVPPGGDGSAAWLLVDVPGLTDDHGTISTGTENFSAKYPKHLLSTAGSHAWDFLNFSPTKGEILISLTVTSGPVTISLPSGAVVAEDSARNLTALATGNYEVSVLTFDSGTSYSVVIIKVS